MSDSGQKPFAEKGPGDKQQRTHQIFFHFDSVEIQPKFQGLLNDIAAELNASPQLRAQITGYTDAIGNPDYNLDLSIRRAIAVTRYLNQRGITADRLATQGKGAYTTTADSADNNQALRRTRMVEISVIFPSE